MSVYESRDEGRLATLRALRDTLAATIDGCEPKEMASLARQLSLVLAQIDELAPAVVEVDAVDEIAARRAARRSGGTKGAARAKRPG